MTSRRRYLQLLGASTGIVLTGIDTVAAHGDNDHDPTTISPQARDQLAEVREATAKYQDVDRAREDGYQSTHHCVSNPNGDGAMGVHFGNRNLIDGEVSATEPEVLVYEPTEDGYDLVAVEYIVPFPLADERPELFGQPFHENDMLEAYTLHAWCWRDNPDGMFAPFNPNVSCD